MASNFRQIPKEKGVVEFRLDLEEMIAVLGAQMAMARSIKQKTYIDALLDEAFETADAAFDVEADALALAGGISHMYEWGTIGVHKGRSSMRIHPQNPKAKLWTNVSMGSGLDRNIVFVYRPSIATVPKPTTADTGMSADVIASMRSHHFEWKAQVIEEGHKVTIKPKEAKFLLIPATKSNRQAYPNWFSDSDLKRGYTLTKKTITGLPGGTEDNEFGKMGTFTAFWDDFWLNRANDIMENEVNLMIQEDYFPEIYKQRAPGMMIPAKAWQFRKEVAESENAVNKRATAKRKLKAKQAAAKRQARKAMK